MIPSPAFPPFPDPIRDWARWTPNRMAVVERARDRRLTYAELDAETERWKAILRRADVRRGQRVALLSGNRLEAVAILLACWRLGASLVPLNWRLAAAELGPILANAEPAVLVTEGKLRGLAEEASRSLGPIPRWIDLDSP